ncbi:ABC transporter substrate-binding protein [Flaviflexus huanghaiensis]|uniref:ABC transporter substrate-binding protein n=1 Tax=Flaviflexus huanghaiensis TaxID=1111473 RepID=UPI0015FE3511|nr:ABC transporter substrate-binding protein [Flaviflexus huanghaiensis]
MKYNKPLKLGALFTGALLVITACSSDTDEAGGDSQEPIEIIGAFTGESADAFSEDLAALSEELGIEATYTPLPDFETVIQSRVAGNDRPDIAIFPQPGLLFDLARDGELKALNDAIDVDSKELVPGLIDTVSDDEGSVFALPVSMNVKSLVWYPVPEFEEAGYTAPSTHDELVELTETIKADGVAPWCFGIESGAATGWPATDWVEEYVLRVGGPEVYDQWVSNEIPFNDPVVQEAGEAIDELLLTEGNVYGGRQAIAATNSNDAVLPLVEDPPNCFMHRQGNFITGVMPDDVQADLENNVGVFLLPPYEGGYDGQPILGGGDFAAVFDAENENVIRVLEGISSPEFPNKWAEAREMMSPYTTFDTSRYGSAILEEIAGLVADADTFRFDGSDMMPGEIGTGAFWREMVSWMSDQVDLNTALDNIEAAWPAS